MSGLRSKKAPLPVEDVAVHSGTLVVVVGSSDEVELTSSALTIAEDSSSRVDIDTRMIAVVKEVVEEE